MTGRPAAVLIALFGPTGLGKTEVAVALALHLDTEIVSADSMQVYAGLPIVTNQPTADQLAGVPHHLVGVVSPAHEYSVAEYAPEARRAIDDVVARRGSVVLEGGSGLYLRAALGGLSFGAVPSPDVRAELERLVVEHPDDARRRLATLDPETAARVDIDNPRRLLRALETVVAQGAPLSPDQHQRLWQHDGEEAGPRVRLFCLEPDRDSLRERVDARVVRMFAAGLVAEVGRARDAAGGLSRSVRQAIGVTEALAVLEGRLSEAEAIAATRARTRRYVRRQLTWMRKLRDADIIAASDRSPDDVASDIRGRLS